MRHLLVALSLLSLLATPAHAQISVGIGLPGVDIGINVPIYPDLVPVPGYPVYYDPRADSNYFFYDGMYWVCREDGWYASSWFNGPWQSVGPRYVPLFVLRVPVRYYRQPPAFFRGWRADAPPRWGEHWGRGWEARRAGWDRWDRRAAPRAAPLPAYQGQFSGDRYPRAMEQQRQIRSENYRYRPREAVTRMQMKPEQERGQPHPMAPRSPSTMREAQPASPRHPARTMPSAPMQHPRGEQRGQEDRNQGEGRGRDHR
jgi:hypothetical protein